MSKKVKISVFVFLVIIAIIVLVHFQTKRIVIELVESNASDRLEVTIGSLNINPFSSSLNLQDVVVMVKEKDSDNYKKTAIRKAFLDVASLWDFYFGGTLVIEKLELQGGELTIYKRTERDTTLHSSFDLSSIIHRIKTDAIRFQIQDLAFKDFNLILVNDSSHLPTTIKHFQFRALDLYLSADSMLTKKPLIEFSFPGQTITFTNGLSVGFDSLFFSTTNNSIQIDKLLLGSADRAGSNSFKVNADKVRIAHFNFEALYSKGIVIIDSVFLGHSNFSVDWKVEPSSNGKAKSPGLPAMPEIDIQHLIVDELASDIRVRQDSIVNSFKVDHAYLTAEHLRHKPDSSRPISTHDFDIILMKYSTFLSKKNTSISFDTVRVHKHGLSLFNFILSTANQLQPFLQTSTIELKQVDWSALLIYKKLVAEEALILNPIVHTVIKSKNNSAPRDNLIVINSLREFLEVQLFTLKNATAYVNLIDRNTNVILKGTHASIRIDEIMESDNITQGLKSVREFSFRNLQVTHPDFTGRVENFNYRQGMPFFGNVAFQANDKININVSDLSLGRIDWDQSLYHLSLDGLGWRTMNVDITGSVQPHQPKDTTRKIPVVQIGRIRGGETQVGYRMHDLKLNAVLHQINLEELKWADSLQVNGIAIRGNDIDFHAAPNGGLIRAFSFTDMGGSFEDIRFSRRSTDSLETQISHVTFRANMPALARRKIVIDELHIDGMKTHYSQHDSTQRLEMEIESNLRLGEVSYLDKKVAVGSLTLEGGPIKFLHDKRVLKAVELSTPSTKRSTMKFRMGVDSLVQSNSSIKAKQTQSNFKQRASIDTSLYTIQSTNLRSGHGGIRLSLSAIEALSGDSTMQVKAKMDLLKLDQVSLINNNLSAIITTGSIHNLLINSNHLIDHRQWIDDNYGTASVNNVKARIETGDNSIQFDHLNYDPKLTTVNLKGFEFKPLKDKQEFLDDSYYQTNFMHTKVDSISFNRLNVKRFLKDSVMHLASLYVASPQLEIHRDKTHAFFATAIKLLPTNAFQKVGIKFKVDTVQFGDGKVSYTEKSRITEKEGTIHFTGLEGMVTNVKNIDLTENDSLYINARTRFLDSAQVILRVKESYRDTLAGFLLTTQVSPFHTSILNPALIPMVAVEFQSGYVDTLQMNAIGREYISLGSMKFLYKDLKVNFLDRNDTAKHSLKNQLIKFAANTFVIRSHNTKRLGTVFYERDRNRAVFQYWVKMILSGATTSVGARSNKKQIKKYLKDLNQKKLPPIDNDFGL